MEDNGFTLVKKKNSSKRRMGKCNIEKRTTEIFGDKNIKIDKDEVKRRVDTAIVDLSSSDYLRKAFKKKNYEISDICQISVTLPTLYPDMDIKKFGHIFYTLTYLPIRKILTKLEKSWYFCKIFRISKILLIHL